MAELGLTANHSAASRRDAPDAMASTTRSRNSKEHGFGIDPPPKIESVPPDSLIQTIPGNTDSTQVKSALEVPEGPAAATSIQNNSGPLLRLACRPVAG
jgi:hypothetical protein